MSKLLAIVLSTAALAVSFPAAAHTEEHFDSISSPNGGQMRMAGPYHLELVTKENEIVVYVANHADKKISTKGGVGKASIQEGKEKPKTTIKLEPAGDNMLKGTGEFSLTPQTTVIVFIKLPGQDAHSARFSPLKPKEKAAKKSPEKTPAKPSPDGNSHHMHH